MKITPTTPFPLHVPHSPACAPTMPAAVRSLPKWCIGALMVLLPGSFLVLAVLWFFRRRTLAGSHK